jgi:hypothetical protein
MTFVLKKVDLFLVKTDLFIIVKIVFGWFHWFTNRFLSVLKTDRFWIFQSLDITVCGQLDA